MFRSYLSLGALICLAAAIGCKSSDNGGDGGNGGNGGDGGNGPGNGGEVTVTLGCTNSVSEDISILEWILSVEPEGAVEPGEEFTAEVGGVAFFGESFLDGALDIITDLKRVALLELAGTVQVRSGGTGDAVVLGPGDIPFTCALPGGDGEAVSCDPANDIDPGQPLLGNTECIPSGAINPCLQYFDLPISDDCSDGGVCDMLGKNEGEDAGSPGDQCARSGFCITDPLPLPLGSETGTYTAANDASEMIFGWDDENTGAEVKEVGKCSLSGASCDPANGDADCMEDTGAGGGGGAAGGGGGNGDGGTCDSLGEVWDLPAAENGFGPNGLQIFAGFSVVLRCTGGIDSADSTSYRVQDQSSPSPDTALLSLQLGALCADVDCDDGNDCTGEVCDPADGSCSNSNFMDGATCDFSDAPGLCSGGTCEDAMLCVGVDCTSENECVGDGTCNDDTGRCDAGPNLSEGTDCGEGGTCDDNGNCVECNEASECPADDDDCTAAACAGGLCGQSDVADGTACGEAGMCVSGACEEPECTVDGDCDDLNQCTADSCDDGSCVNANLPDMTACMVGSEDGMCDGQGTCVTASCGPDTCDDDNECTTDVCDPGADPLCTNTPQAQGTPCDAGTGAGSGNCGGDPIMCVALIDPCQDTPQANCEKVITVACGNNVTGDVSVLPYLLTVDPGPIGHGRSFDAELGGVAEFSEQFLDAAQGAVPGGVTKAILVDLTATVQVRGDGATGPAVALSGGGNIPYECLLDDTGPGAQQPCDPANDEASVPGSRGNTDCVPTGFFNPCGRIALVPTSANCVPGGTCDDLGKLTQCTTNGFCVTGGLPLALDPATGSYAAGDGTTDALFGWFDDPADQVPTIGDPFHNGDGTWNLEGSMYTGIAGPIGLAVNAGGLAVQLECIMGTDAEDAMPPISNASFPTEDVDLLSFPVQ